jgi:uncharacterized protein YbjT (DUF2867 family)
MSTSAAPTDVIGATGKQGGAVVTSVLDRGAPVRAIIRNVGGGDDLVKRGAEVSIADLANGEALRRAFDGLAAVFAVTTFSGPMGTEGEVVHGCDRRRGARHASAAPRLQPRRCRQPW